MATESECYRVGFAILLGFGSLAPISSGKSYALPSHLAGISLFKSDLFRKYQKKGAKVLAYLPNNNDDINAAINAGADEILVDIKPDTLEIIKQQLSPSIAEAPIK